MNDDADLPEGAVILSSVRIVRYLDAEGTECVVIDESDGMGHIEVLGVLALASADIAHRSVGE